MRRFLSRSRQIQRPILLVTPDACATGITLAPQNARLWTNRKFAGVRKTNATRFVRSMTWFVGCEHCGLSTRARRNALNMTVNFIFNNGSAWSSLSKMQRLNVSSQMAIAGAWRLLKRTEGAGARRQSSGPRGRRSDPPDARRGQLPHVGSSHRPCDQHETRKFEQAGRCNQGGTRKPTRSMGLSEPEWQIVAFPMQSHVASHPHPGWIATPKPCPWGWLCQYEITLPSHRRRNFDHFNP